MLKLNRKIGQAVIIAKGTPYETKIIVEGHRNGLVKLAFDASRDVQIDREEVANLPDEERRLPRSY